MNFVSSIRSLFRCFLIVVIFISLSLSSQGQKIVVGSSPVREYVFKTKEDSITWHKIDSIFTKSGNPWLANNRKFFDSLLYLRNELFGRSIGTRYAYKPRYVLWEDLDSAKRESVTRLSLYNWDYEKLPRELMQCVNLEKLEIINSKVGLVPKELNALSKLKTLEIYNNRPVGRLRFGKNQTLTLLLIRANHSGKLPKSYRKLKSIERLDLSRTRLEAIPKVYANRKLKELVLTDNVIDKIQLNRFRKQKSLKDLDLRINKIAVVPSTIKNLPNLKSLSLNVNQIAWVSPKIGKLRELEDLSFYNNQLTEIPAALYTLKTLKKIDLYHNRIDKLDSSVSSLTNLSILGLDDNNIKSLPSSMGGMNSLREIYLNRNRLSNLPESLSKLTHMRAIEINHNYLTEFPNQILNLTELVNLDISNNKITSVPAELFDFKNFEILSLYGNPYDRESLEKLPGLITKIQSEKTSVIYEAPGN